MFDNKELTRIMSMVVNESVNIQKEINECDSDLEKETLERDLTTVNGIGSKISKVINS
jgi:predicted flap endonuclease-1-like 5' DNA nuclease